MWSRGEDDCDETEGSGMCPPSPRAIKFDMWDFNTRDQSANVALKFGQGQRIIAYAKSEKKDFKK